MYDVNILVNGSRCKQYHHDGKIFIEAKDGSEYTIEIKNNVWKRILAVCSVDGLDVLTGKKAVENNPGYVISGLNTLKIDGFRVSDDKVAKFIFGAKGDSYAADKGDGSERNVGVIGIRLFEEKYVPPPQPTVIREEHHHHHYPRPRPYWDYPTIWCDSTFTRSTDATFGSTLCNAGGDSLGASAPLGDTLDCCESDNALYSCDNIPTKGRSTSKGGEYMSKKRSFSGQMKDSSTGQSENVLRAMSFCGQVQPQPRGFDMGTKWGEAKESRVVEVEFERGILALSTNIYYASRQSLLEMGIPLGNEKQVSFPEPFVDTKYAKPPKNWRG